MSDKLRNIRNEMIAASESGKTEITFDIQTLLSLFEEIENSYQPRNSLEYSELARHLNQI